ncbi:MAG TPA: hypothetical protein VEP70_10120, partial [Burkholderiales bacterium]|nr:hypothetical protein [Burkholderiales bacterium]
LYDESGTEETARFDLPEFTNEIWHGYIPGIEPGTLYGYRVHGPYDDRARLCAGCRLRQRGSCREDREGVRVPWRSQSGM